MTFDLSCVVYIILIKSNSKCDYDVKQTNEMKPLKEVVRPPSAQLRSETSDHRPEARSGICVLRSEIRAMRGLQ